MITCNLIGGLGNQLFQIFTTLSYSTKTKKKFIFLNSETVGTGKTRVRNTYWKNLLYKLKPFLKNNFSNYLFIKEKEFGFNDIIEEINNNIFSNTNICLCGYFQSYKYFQDNFYLFYRLLDIEKQKEKVLNSFNTFSLENTISIHFRIGDYKLLPNVYPILTYDYYEKALSHIQKENYIFLRILIFCEDEDLEDVNIIIEKLKIKFPDNSFKIVPNILEDWEQMLLMSCCSHNIIANSTFSWWGAYFNMKHDKIVCYPETWFVNNTDTSDLCPPEWKKIQI